MDNNKKNQDLKNGQKLAPSVNNDQLGENNGESGCGCSGNNIGDAGSKSKGGNTCK